MNVILSLARADLLALPGYRAAAYRPGLVRLHANEVPWRAPGDRSQRGLNRYPEPQPSALRERLASLYGAGPERLLITRGSDDAIDLLVRAFCRAGQDAIQICPPTFEMYRHAAELQGAAVVETALDPEDFGLRAEQVLRDHRPAIKLLFLCSPNNPSGNLLERGAVLGLATALAGRALVVVDEAYQEFAPGRGLIDALAAHDNLVVLRTLSKAHALAGARCGILLGHPALIGLLRRLMPPYPLAETTVQAALRALQPQALARTEQRIARLCATRERLARALARLPGVCRVWPSVANFLLLRVEHPATMIERAQRAGLLLRDFSDRPGLDGCVRVTVGSAAQNAALLTALRGQR